MIEESVCLESIEVNIAYVKPDAELVARYVSEIKSGTERKLHVFVSNMMMLPSVDEWEEYMYEVPDIYEVSNNVDDISYATALKQIEEEKKASTPKDEFYCCQTRIACLVDDYEITRYEVDENLEPIMETATVVHEFH